MAMSAYPESPETELPDAHACLVLWRVSVEAHLSMLPRKKAERFLDRMADTLANEQRLAQLFSIRPSSEWAAVQLARRQAAEVFSRFMPLFTAKLRERD